MAQIDQGRYVRAGGRLSVAALYDPIVAVTMRERAWRDPFCEQVSATVPAGGRIVEVGVGTGAVAIPLAAARRDATVVGIDGDEQILRLAQRKRGGDLVDWRTGLANALPIEDGKADALVMSLLLHHLGPAAKPAALSEAVRVLRPGGYLHVADWGRPRDPLMHAMFFALRLVDGLEPTADHAAGRVPQQLRDAGLREVACHRRLRTAWGSLELLSARRS
jgi:ubiquinone/menaquinone biosynthesis C-methylase UbiE